MGVLKTDGICSDLKKGYFDVFTGDEFVPPRVSGKVAEYKDAMNKVTIDYKEAKHRGTRRMIRPMQSLC